MDEKSLISAEDQRVGKMRVLARIIRVHKSLCVEIIMKSTTPVVMYCIINVESTTLIV